MFNQYKVVNISYINNKVKIKVVKIEDRNTLIFYENKEPLDIVNNEIEFNEQVRDYLIGNKLFNFENRIKYKLFDKYKDLINYYNEIEDIL